MYHSRFEQETSRIQLNSIAVLHFLDKLRGHSLSVTIGNNFYIVIGQDSGTLQAERSGDRIPVGARFSAPVDTALGLNQPHVQLVQFVSFSVLKRPGRGFGHPPTSKDHVKERVELYIYYHFGPSLLF